MFVRLSCLQTLDFVFLAAGKTSSLLIWKKLIRKVKTKNPISIMLSMLMPVNKPRVPPMVPSWSMKVTRGSLADFVTVFVGLSTDTIAIYSAT